MSDLTWCSVEETAQAVAYARSIRPWVTSIPEVFLRCDAGHIVMSGSGSKTHQAALSACSIRVPRRGVPWKERTACEALQRLVTTLDLADPGVKEELAQWLLPPASVVEQRLKAKMSEFDAATDAALAVLLDADATYTMREDVAKRLAEAHGRPLPVPATEEG